MTTHAGSCLCGVVRFTVTGDLPPGVATALRQLQGVLPFPR